MKRSIIMFASALTAAFLFLPTISFADTVQTNFEPATYTIGNINGQDGWLKTGAYDVAVFATTSMPVSFGTQSLRISDAVTSGAFGDQTFVKPLINSVGETVATAGTFATGTKQAHFEMQFDIASIMQVQQPGMHLAVSPDRGDGSRMSYLRFEDDTTGIHVYFDDVVDAGPIGTVASFNETDLGIVSRTIPHTIKLTMDMIDGPANDVVKVYIDNTLVHTGTSWEDYYRYDPEAVAEQSPRVIKTVGFRESGTAHLLNQGNGYLIDNFSILSGPITPVIPTTVTVTIDKFINGAKATATTASNATFPMLATWNASNIGAGSGSYTLDVANSYGTATIPLNTGADYSTSEVTNGAVVGASCTAGTPFALAGYSTGTSLAAAMAAATSTTMPSFTNLQGNQFVIVRNVTCPAAATTTLKVHILKYLDGVMATALNASSTSFPMTATWSATNIGSGTGSFTLGPVGYNSAIAYEAITADMTTGASYSVVENVPATCDAGNPYALAGYSTGTTSALAAAAATTTVAPSFTAMTANQYVVVRNKTCVATTTPPGLGEIRGIKFEDWDADKSPYESKWEVKLSGWTIYLDTNNNGILDSGETSTTTDGHGAYGFVGLTPGTYYVREVAKSGWIQITPMSGAYTVVISAGQIVKNKNFGNFKLGNISGMKFEDKNGNHRKDVGEMGLAGWTVKLKGPGSFASSTVTDANGNYSFFGLTQGTYKISEVMQTGWRQTVHPKPVKVNSGTGAINKNFGNKQKINDRSDGRDVEDDD